MWHFMSLYHICLDVELQFFLGALINCSRAISLLAILTNSFIYLLVLLSYDVSITALLSSCSKN